MPVAVVDEDIIVSLCIPVYLCLSLCVCRILENRNSDAAVFFYRQFWTCIKVCARFDNSSSNISQLT